MLRSSSSNFSFIVLALSVVAICCKTREVPTTLEIQSANILRGDVTLCGKSELGEVEFGVDCRPEAQPHFKLGLALLHSFEYADAEKAFAKTIDADPGCAMAYWGVAMSNFHALWVQDGNNHLVKGTRVLQLAESLETTRREREYLDAINVFYKDWESVEQKVRVERYLEKMESLYKRYPEDAEAAIFYSLALTASADPKDKTYASQLKSGAILEKLMVDRPDHPGIAHYIIHNYDYPELAEKALATARRYASIAPASAHAQHMPSHIFTRLGLWEESIQSNLSSIDASRCLIESIDPGAHSDEEFHGMDYLVYALLQQGKTEKAIEQYKFMLTFDRINPVNFKVAYAVAAIPSRIYLESRDWTGAMHAELPDLNINWTQYPWQKSLLLFARGIGAARAGFINEAKNNLGELDLQYRALLGQGNDYMAAQVMFQIRGLEAWVAFKEGLTQKGLELMKEAVTMERAIAKHPVSPGAILPSGELLGDMLFEMNRPLEALAAYEEDLRYHPNRFNGLYGAYKSARRAGAKEKSDNYLKLLARLASDPESTRKEIFEAEQLLAGR